MTNPGEFGFTQLPPASCLDGSPFTVALGNSTPCDAPDEHVFWDEVHPTTRTHELIADLALETLEAQQPAPASVPEPTAALPLGLLGIGLFLRRHFKARC